ncbi:type I DNA topoisomerase [Dehalobacter sp. DCM]|uniref:type I DNA topoisomerase n=1 Tax=Dehalobacter sp. DCM TaxID=2907827 RepID=UPI003082056E|nr:type I DNA topoisomerase [Dehalobacter sp. DCM]
MAKTLVIVESPAKAKSISKFLSKNYLVKASMGHLRDLPKSQIGVDIDRNFEPKYIAIRGRGDLVKDLKASAKAADKVLLASDPDREGEAIAWHLMHLLGLDPETSARVEFHEITKPTILNAVKNARKVDMDLVNAQQARRVLDRLVGYKLSPLLWRKVKKGLSAGRVQSVAVRIICDREEEIRGFEPEEYWTLEASLVYAGGIFTAKLLHKNGKKLTITGRDQMDGVLSDLRSAVFRVAEVKTKEKRRQPAPPFTTSSLQQEAYRKLNYSPKKTMMLAQQLYEGVDLGKNGTVGLITYMRTDSVRIAETAQEEAKAYILENHGDPYYPPETRIFTSKGRAQEAHEAIRPTSVLRTPDAVKPYLGRDLLKLYRLIWDRFVASQMSAAVYDTLTVDIQADNYLFRANASSVKFPGYLAVYEESLDEPEKQENPESSLKGNLEANQQLHLESLQERQHFTEPPPRFTEASLVRKMEEEGIGRPSTYAPTIETIQTRGYVVKEEKKLVPTELGEIIVTLLKEHFPDIVDLEFTANMEEKLDSIEDGKVDWKQVIGEFYGPFAETLEIAEQTIGKIKVQDEVSDEVCELCGRNMVIKMGRFGKFLACPGFPDCRNARPLLEEIGVNCPKCGEKLVARRSKKGRKFYGCSKYPECDFIAWEKPAPYPCPECGGAMVEKNSKRSRKYVCTNKDCRHIEELKDNE